MAVSGETPLRFLARQCELENAVSRRAQNTVATASYAPTLVENVENCSVAQPKKKGV